VSILLGLCALWVLLAVFGVKEHHFVADLKLAVDLALRSAVVHLNPSLNLILIIHQKRKLALVHVCDLFINSQVLTNVVDQLALLLLLFFLLLHEVLGKQIELIVD
jgi:hypothetical protein